jgi:hypothetical protein
MNKFHCIAGLILVSTIFCAPLAVQACPACTEMVASSTDVDDADNFAAAVNESICVMLGVPFSALFVVGFMIYRGMKKNDEFRAKGCSSLMPLAA